MSVPAVPGFLWGDEKVPGMVRVQILICQNVTGKDDFCPLVEEVHIGLVELSDVKSHGVTLFEEIDASDD